MVLVPGEFVGFLLLLDTDLRFLVELGGGPLVRQWYVECTFCAKRFWVPERDLRRVHRSACCPEPGCVEQARKMLGLQLAFERSERARRRREANGAKVSEPSTKDKKIAAVVGVTFGRLQVLGYARPPIESGLGSGIVCSCTVCGGYEVVRWVSYLSIRGQAKCKGRCMSVETVQPFVEAIK